MKISKSFRVFCVQQFHKPRKAQLSLEFLLVMAGFVLALTLFVPIAIKSSKAVLFAIEIERANEFLSEFESSASQISFLSNGTIKEIKTNARNEWLFKASNGVAKITIKSDSLGIEKTISKSIPLEVQEFIQKFKGESILRIEKYNDSLLLSSISVD